MQTWVWVSHLVLCAHAGGGEHVPTATPMLPNLLEPLGSMATRSHQTDDRCFIGRFAIGSFDFERRTAAVHSEHVYSSLFISVLAICVAAGSACVRNSVPR